MKLFLRLLRVDVVSYSHVDGNQRDPETMHQGLCIGNATEGFFANLNSSKTEFAESKADVNRLRAKAYELEDPSPGVDEEEEAPVVLPQIADMPFDEFQKKFGVNDKLEKAQAAKDFCHFLAKKLVISERRPWHIDRLEAILTRWHGSAKHASWSLAESFARPECPEETRRHAEAVVMKCLKDVQVTNYAKYRLLHHLTRRRKSGDRYWERLRTANKRELKTLLPAFLREKAFELNIIALYAMRCLGASSADLRIAVDQHARVPVPLPIKNSLSSVSESTAKRPKQLPAFAPIGDEEGETEDRY